MTSGHSTVICNSGEEAIDCLQEESFDLLLLDYKMGGISGIDVLQWMLEKNKDIPVILITAHGSEEIALEAWKWRAKDYFVKGTSDLAQLPQLLIDTYKKWVIGKMDKPK
jgi:two-component system, NtrC family, sensor kinase